MMSSTFTAIDFETATNYFHSICAVGIVRVENGSIKDTFYSLVQPPDNYYFWRNIQVHGIRPEDTKDVPHFPEIFEQMREYIEGRILVAHNEVFDRNVLQKTMLYYGMDYKSLQLSDKWECSCKIYRTKGFRPANLKACCDRLGIPLKHHEALSDAKACAQLYLHHLKEQEVQLL